MMPAGNNAVRPYSRKDERTRLLAPDSSKFSREAEEGNADQWPGNVRGPYRQAKRLNRHTPGTSPFAGAPSGAGRGAIFKRVQFLAGLETNSLAGGDADLSAGPRIAADAGFAGADAENAKSAQFDALAGGQGLLQALENRIHRSLCLGARQARALDYVMDDVLFNQWGILAGATGIDCTTTYSGDATDFASNMEQQNSEAWDFLLRKSGQFRPGQLGTLPSEHGLRAISIVNSSAAFVR